MSVEFSALNKYASHCSKLHLLGISSTSLSLLPPNSPSENTLLLQANQPQLLQLWLQVFSPPDLPHLKPTAIPCRCFHVVHLGYCLCLVLHRAASEHSCSNLPSDFSLQPKLDQETSSWSKKAEKDTAISVPLGKSPWLPGLSFLIRYDPF